jgi:hypothetical protein
MSSCRKFIQNSVIGSAAAFAGANVFAATEKSNKVIKGNSIVVATWDFGKAANVGDGKY